jgi:hypothetical protein
MNPRQRKKPKYLDPGIINIIKQIFFGVLVFSVVALIITAIWYATRVTAFTISKVTVEGGVTINKDFVKKTAEEQLEGTYMKLVPKRFAFTYPEENIFDSVIQVERIRDVQVQRVSGTEIRVTFDEFLPDSLWCSLNEQTNCLFLDDLGFAFAKAPSLTGESMVRYLTTEQEVEIGTTPLTLEDYNATKGFADSLAGLDWYITKVEVNSTRDVFYTLAGGGEIKATLTESIQKPISNLETILGSKEFSHLKPGNFRYLDLRFGSRVFVNEEMEEIKEEVESEEIEEVATSTPEVVIEEE